MFKVVGLLDPAGGGRASVSATATTDDGPIDGANIRMSLLHGGEGELAVAREDANPEGLAHVMLAPDHEVAPGTPLEVRVALSPTRGTGLRRHQPFFCCLIL